MGLKLHVTNPREATRREARFTIVMWIVACLYTVGYAAINGYKASPLIGGIPQWVVLGVLFPWMVCTLITAWFSLCVMKDEDLGE